VEESSFALGSQFPRIAFLWSCPAGLAGQRSNPLQHPRNISSSNIPRSSVGVWHERESVRLFYCHRSSTDPRGRKLMVKSDGFYLHETWPGGLDTITLHRGDCPRCNDGKGPLQGYSTSGKWHGPFKSQKDAEARSSTLLHVTVRAICDCIRTGT
jgi:hypothetical protein